MHKVRVNGSLISLLETATRNVGWCSGAHMQSVRVHVHVHVRVHVQSPGEGADQARMSRLTGASTANGRIRRHVPDGNLTCPLHVCVAPVKVGGAWPIIASPVLPISQLNSAKLNSVQSWLAASPRGRSLSCLAHHTFYLLSSLSLLLTRPPLHWPWRLPSQPALYARVPQRSSFCPASHPNVTVIAAMTAMSSALVSCFKPC